MTAHALNSYVEKCMEAGMDDYITKPVVRKHLIATVAKWAHIHSTLDNATIQVNTELPDSTTDPVPINLQEAAEELEGDVEFLVQLTIDFLVNIHTQMPLIQAGIENDEVDVVEWMASDLTSEDVFIDNEDEISNTPAARKQKVIELLQYKAFSNDVDPKTRSRLIKLMELGDWENADDSEEQHISKAKRENKFLAEGIPPNFKPYDMHELHIQEHNRYRLDVEYEQFEKANPEMAMVFDLHVQQHEAAIQMATQQALMAQVAAQPVK
jgi:CheY-like chemotaxis protein